MTGHGGEFFLSKAPDSHWIGGDPGGAWNVVGVKGVLPTMSTVDLTAQTLDDTLDAEGITLIDWWASWCGPCKQFGPVYEQASEQHDDITFAKINTETEQELSSSVGISSIPTLMAFRDGVLVFQQAGALPAPALENLIEQVRGLDMVEVKQKLAEQEAAEPAADKA